jgi:hypothetical protein
MNEHFLLPIIGCFLAGWLFGGLLILAPRGARIVRQRLTRRRPGRRFDA